MVGFIQRITLCATVMAAASFWIIENAGAADAAKKVAPVSGGKALAPPELSKVGPRVKLASREGGMLPPGEYSGQHFTTAVDLGGTGDYKFTDCELLFNTVNGAQGRTVLLDHCRTGGIYFAEGGQSGWTILFSYMLGGNQALRPSNGRNGWDVKTPTPFVVEDSIVEISSLGTPQAHVEAMQTLGGNSMRFSRVRFITHGPKNDGVTGQTASINVNAGKSLFEDCEFLDAGAYYYTVYSDGPDNVFVRCRFGKGAASYFYPTTGDRIAPVVKDCTDIDTKGKVGP